VLESNNTIAAIATPMGRGGIGVIRVSGVDALAICSKLSPHLDISSIESRHVYFTSFINCQDGAHIDEGCFVYFQAPHSYTGEHVVELQCHSNPFILNLILSQLHLLGAKLATAGEFTKRAFYNGKMDLTQAESVIDLIDANNKASHQVALSQVQGSLFETIKEIRHSLMLVLQQVEGSIDFPDEVDPINKLETPVTLKRYLDVFSRIIKQKDYGELIRSGVKVLILGRPNVGKSSLFNQLVGKDRSIVTDIPGTTRDYIETDITLGTHLVKLIDTAGMRVSGDKIEQMGIDKIETLIDEAHIILWVLDQSEVFTAEDKRVCDIVSAHSSLILLKNKNDLDCKLVTPELLDNKPTISLSINSQEGIDAVKLELVDTISKNLKELDLDLLCNIRQIGCIHAVKESLESFVNGLEDNVLEDDVIALDLKTCILKLGEITGDEVSEEVLDGVFSRFCVGK
jgi:tRNA modification GTPase